MQENPFQNRISFVVNKAGSGLDCFTIYNCLPLDIVGRTETFLLHNFICLSITIESKSSTDRNCNVQEEPLAQNEEQKILHSEAQKQQNEEFISKFHHFTTEVKLLRDVNSRFEQQIAMQDKTLKKLFKKNRQLAVEFNTFQIDIQSKVDNIFMQLNHLSTEQTESIHALTNQLTTSLNGFQATTQGEDHAMNMVVTSLSNHPMTSSSFYSTFHNTSPWVGQLKWRINNYQDVKRQAETQQQFKLRSEEFVTEMGYCFCMELFPNGVEKAIGQFMSITLKLLPGNQDNGLEWPFFGQANISVLGTNGEAWFDKPAPLQFDRSVGQKRSSLCIPKFLSHAMIDEEFHSATNDFLDLQVVIEET